MRMPTAVWVTLFCLAAGPPGVVVDHEPSDSGVFVGSPTIAILLDGSYVAGHDQFGPKSAYSTHAVTKFFRSTDRGVTWTASSKITDALWGGLFVHKSDVYWIGTRHEYGDLLVRRSTDGGRSWTDPAVLGAGHFHTAPVPVVEYGGKLWRGVEDADGPRGWGKCFRARMISAAVDADLLSAKSWTVSAPMARDGSWLDGKFGGWLEGNAVVTPTGVIDLLRVDYPPKEGIAAIQHVAADGKSATFDPSVDFVPMPAGDKKFTVRFDPETKLYVTLGNVILPRGSRADPGSVRNTIALLTSSDLLKWTDRGVLLHHDDFARHGFQYLDWQFDGPDLIAVSRTAFDDEKGSPGRAHDANYLTFHRFARWRDSTK